MSLKSSKLTEQDFYKYLLKLYFKDESIEACVRRAYLDLNRTLHGISKHQGNKDLTEKAKQKVIEILNGMKNRKFECENEFDKYNKNASKQLKNLYCKKGFKGFYIGHSQKWINMSLKYIFTMKRERIPGFKDIYQYSHIPLDNKIINALVEHYGFEGLNNTTWSRIDDYEEYLKIQKWIRENFPKCIPMDVEFRIWNGEICI